MYCQLLEKAVLELKSGKKIPLLETMIDIGITGKIPEAYIASQTRRLAMYRRFADCEDQESVAIIVNDLKSGYGELPDSVCKLVQYHELRVASSQLGILSMTIDEQDIVIRTKNSKGLSRQMQGAKGTLRPVGVPSATGFVAVYYRPARLGNTVEVLEQLHSKLVESSSLH
jgi:transcription-repair coupling factor (superfamily II helicase)